MELMENTLLRCKAKETIRIVYCNLVSSIIYVVDMEAMRWPYAVRKDELIDDIKSGEIVVLERDPYTRLVAEEELSEAEKERRGRAWNIVNFILQQIESEILMFQSKYREKAIKLAVEFYGVNYTTVKNYLIRYWQGGKIRNGLLPKFNLCGSKGEERKNTGKKRGRPRKSGNSGINIDEDIKKYFKIGLNRYYYNGRENSLKITYELILRDFFTEASIDSKGNKISVIRDSTKIPTYNQFLYWYKKFNDPKKELINRKGARNYFLNHRTIIGDSTQDAGFGPGTLWQIDATPLDAYLVSSVNRNLVVGRGTLYLVIDVFSRLIVGMNVSFEPFNSYTGAMVALANAMLPKNNYCKQYGITLDKNEWDVACVPQRIFADRGELTGTQIEDAIANLGISVQNAPPYRADYKGIIEQAFAQLNLKVKPFADGVVKDGSITIERGEEDYRLKANLTIDEFTKIIIKCVLFHNNHHVLSDYVLDDMMLAENVEKIPAKIWEYGLKNMKGRLRTLPETTIRMHLLPTDFASVTSRGVKFKKMLYVSDYSLRNHWFQNARINGSKKIKIWYDPRDLSHIYVINEDEEFHELDLLDHLTKFKNRGMEEIKEIIKYEESFDFKSKEKELQAKMELFDDIENIVEAGREKTLAEKNESLNKAQRLKGIKDNQKMERELEREKVRKKNENNNPGEDSTTYLEDYTNEYDELDIFKTLRDTDWNEKDE